MSHKNKFPASLVFHSDEITYADSITGIEEKWIPISQAEKYQKWRQCKAGASEQLLPYPEINTQIVYVRDCLLDLRSKFQKLFASEIQHQTFGTVAAPLRKNRNLIDVYRLSDKPEKVILVENQIPISPEIVPMHESIPLYSERFFVVSDEITTIIRICNDLLRNNLVYHVNQLRNTHGLPSLTYNTALQKAADSHAEDMFNKNYFSHVNLEGLHSGQRIMNAGYGPQVQGRWNTYVGENLAKGQTRSEQVVAEWLASPPHRAAMLDEGYKEIGVGISLVNIWVANFGSIRDCTINKQILKIDSHQET